MRGKVASLIAGTTRLGSVLGPAAGGAIALWSIRAPFWIQTACFFCASALVYLLFGILLSEWRKQVTLEATLTGAPAPANVRDSIALPAPELKPPEAGTATRHNSLSEKSSLGEKSLTESSTSSSQSRTSEVSEADLESTKAVFPPVAIGLMPVSMAIAMVRSVREMLLPLIAADLGMSSDTTGYVIAASFAFDMALVPLTGYIMDKYGRKRAGLPSLVLQAAGFVCLAFARSLWSLVGAALLLGAGNGLSNGWVQVVGADIAPAGHSASFLGYWAAVLNLGLTLGPAMAGTLSHYTSNAVSSALIGLVSLLAALWYLAIGEETLGWEKPPAGLRGLI